MFDDWIRAGMDAGFCGPPVCYTHDGLPTSVVEDDAFDEGFDPCLSVVRLYEDAGVAAGVAANHSPSVWRAEGWA